MVKRGGRDEKGLQRSLWDLWGTDAGAEAANEAMFRQLPHTDPAVRRLRAEAHRRVAWLPSNSPGPDFGLVDPPSPSTKQSNIRLVAEIKVGARANWDRGWNVRNLPELRDSTAQAITQAYSVDPSWNWAQIDVYRGRHWWHSRDLCTMNDPEDVVWVFMDIHGRSARDAFYPSGGAAAPEIWHSFHLQEFAAEGNCLPRATGLTTPPSH